MRSRRCDRSSREVAGETDPWKNLRMRDQIQQDPVIVLLPRPLPPPPLSRLISKKNPLGRNRAFTITVPVTGTISMNALPRCAHRSQNRGSGSQRGSLWAGRPTNRPEMFRIRNHESKRRRPLLLRDATGRVRRLHKLYSASVIPQKVAFLGFFATSSVVIGTGARIIQLRLTGEFGGAAVRLVFPAHPH